MTAIAPMNATWALSEHHCNPRQTSGEQIWDGVLTTNVSELGMKLNEGLETIRDGLGESRTLGSSERPGRAEQPRTAAKTEILRTP